MTRSHTPPSGPASEQSSPAYHQSIDDSVTTLSDSWIPIPDPVSPAHSLSTSSASDHDTLSTLGSGSEHGDGDDDTAGFLTDSSDDHDHDHDHAEAIDLLDGEEYTDAESPATDLRASNSTLGASSAHSSLIYPFADGGSFPSSATASVSISDHTTPNASVGALPVVPEVQRLERMSAYRLERMAAKSTVSVADKGEKGRDASDGVAHGGLSEYKESKWPFDSDIQQMSRDIAAELLLASTPLAQKDGEITVKQDVHGSTAKEIRQGVKDDRIRRGLAVAKAAGVRVGTQKWSLKMSLFTLASLVGVVLATARYWTSSATSKTATVPAPVQTPRAFSILDYLSASSLSSSGLFDTAPSSVMPDARLIKNALSLSTKAVPLSPAEIRGTKRSTQVKVKGDTTKAKSGHSGSTSHSLSVRTTEAGLTTFFDGSTAWQKTLRGIVRPSPASSSLGGDSTLAKKDCFCDCGYGEMIISDIKTAWSRALSGFSHSDLIHFIQTQVLDTIKREIQEAIALAAQVLSVSKKATFATGRHLRKAAYQSSKHVSTVYGDIKTYGKSVNVTATTQRAYDAAHAARSGLGVVSSQAAMTSKKGKEAIYKARAGLDYLIAEARRARGSGGDDNQISNAAGAPKGFSVRERFRSHRVGVGRGKGQTKAGPVKAKPTRKGSDNVKGKAKGKGKKASNVNANLNVKTKGDHIASTQSTLKQKLMSALHDAALAFVI